MAKTTYNYARGTVPAGSKSGAYDIDNPYSNQSLAQDIKDALPGITFQVSCLDTNCDVITDPALSEGDETTLGNTVSTHQAVTESDQLETNKSIRHDEVDERSVELIGAGFVHNAEIFSASIPAQGNWDRIKNQEGSYSYPKEIATKNNYKYSLPQSEVASFWDAKEAFVNDILTAGVDLNVLITDAVDQAALDAIVDNR